MNIIKTRAHIFHATAQAPLSRFNTKTKCFDKSKNIYQRGQGKEEEMGKCGEWDAKKYGFLAGAFFFGANQRDEPK